jgi:hypothetical protein
MMPIQAERRSVAVSGVYKIPVVMNDVGKQRTIAPKTNCAVTSQGIQLGTNRPLGKSEKMRR